MAVTPARSAGPTPRGRVVISRAGWLSVAAATGAVTAAASVGPALAVVVGCAVAAVGCGICAVILIRLALTIHARQHAGPRRGAGYLGMGMLLAGAGVAATGVTAVLSGAVPASLVAGATMALTVPTNLFGLLQLADRRVPHGARFGRGLDGLGIGAGLLFTGWLMVTPRGGLGAVARGGLGAVALGSTALAAVSLSVAAIIGVRSTRSHPAATVCGAGTALTALGLGVLTVHLDGANTFDGTGGSQAPWIALGTLALLAGALLIATGAAHTDRFSPDQPSPEPAAPAPHPPGPPAEQPQAEQPQTQQPQTQQPQTAPAAMVDRRTAIGQELPGAQDRGELELVFQPIVELIYGQPVGVEALLRWWHPRLGNVAPSEFLAIADDLGLADDLQRWVLHRACRQLASWRRDGRAVWISINIATAQLTADSFLGAVTTALDTHGVPAGSLIIEVAEPGVVDDTVAVARLAGLRSLGVRTALDHFGTAPTALARLRRLPIDVLKIDPALFADPAGAPGALGPAVPPAASRTASTSTANPVVDMVVELAKRLAIDVIAVGVETRAQLTIVRGAGCAHAQGFLFAAPGHTEHIEAFLDSHRAYIF